MTFLPAAVKLKVVCKSDPQYAASKPEELIVNMILPSPILINDFQNDVDVCDPAI